MAYEIETGLRSETEKATAEGRRILSLMSTRLKDDDKSLSTLERLVSGTDMAMTSDDASTIRYTTDLSAALAGYTSEEIHYRLDRSFLESILDPEPGHHHGEITGAVDDELISALEGELDSLYPEIGILAEMSTKQQFSEPLLRELRSRHDQMRVTSHRKLAHVSCHRRGWPVNQLYSQELTCYKGR